MPTNDGPRGPPESDLEKDLTEDVVRIEFGVIDHVDFQEIPIHQTFDERLEQIVKFDEDGFYAYHITEHHFTPHGLASSPIAFLAAAARLTKRIKLIPTVFVIPTYHPLRLAEEICMLDQLSHGRVEFGAGRGIVPHELSLFGINPHEAADIMKEGLEVVSRALDSDRVTYRGDYYKFYDVPMILRPHHPFKNRGMWVTSGRPEAARAAGANGDHLMMIVHPAEARKFVDAFMDGWSKDHGSQDPLPKLGLTRHVYVCHDQAEAERRGEFGFAGWFGNHSWMWKRFDHSRGSGDDSPYRHRKAIIFGTPEFVRQELASQIEESGGVNYLAPRFAFGNLTQEEVFRSYQLFRDEVMPHFADLKANRAAAA